MSLRALLPLLFLLAAVASTATAFCPPPRAWTSPAPAATRRAAGVRTMEMKRKGKANVPIAQRGMYNKVRQADEVLQQQKEMQESGMPVFELFTRVAGKGVWYPCGNLGGDERARTTIDGWVSGGWLEGVYQETICKGVADSVLSDRQRLVDQVTRMYPQLKKTQANLEFGFKIAYAPLQAKQAAENTKPEITVLVEEMRLNIFEKAKKKFGL